jgi:hypothetical protein
MKGSFSNFSPKIRNNFSAEGATFEFAQNNTQTGFEGPEKRLQINFKVYILFYVKDLTFLEKH